MLKRRPVTKCEHTRAPTALKINSGLLYLFIGLHAVALCGGPGNHQVDIGTGASAGTGTGRIEGSRWAPIACDHDEILAYRGLPASWASKINPR